MDARIAAVEERVLGSGLVSNVSIGGGTLTISDGTEFDLTGQVLLGSEVLTYTNIDEETGVITLSGTLAANHSADDIVYLYPLSQERVAYLVAGDDPKDEEGMAARIPHALWDKIPVGIRDWPLGEGETVQADFIGDELVIMELTGQVPVIDASFIDPGSFTAPPSDGIPPTTSPTPVVVAGIGTLFATWAPIANGDPVSYEVHVSVTTGFTPSGTVPGTGTCYAVVEGGICVIKTDPATGVALVYDTPYYVKLVARDVDGSAAASAQGTATPIKANTPDIAVDAITAAQILANSILADKLAASIILATVFKTAETGRRVEVGPAGITLYAADETVLVSIPTDVLQNVQFRGDIVTGNITITGGLAISGSTNIMDKGSVLELQSKLADPSTPTLTFEYKTQLVSSPITGEPEIHGFDFDTNGNGSTTDTFLMLGVGGSSVNLYEVDVASNPCTLLRSSSLFPSSNVGGASGKHDLVYGVARCGGYIWVLYESSVGGNIVLRAFDASTLAAASTTTITPGVNSSQRLALGSDGTNLLILGWATGSVGSDKKVQVVTISGSTPSMGSTFSLTGGRTRVSDSMLGGITGRDGTNYTTVMKVVSTGNTISVFENFLQTTKALNTADGSVWTPDAVTPGGDNVGECWMGVAYDGTSYHTIGRLTAIIQNFSAWVWTPGSNGDRWWMGYTWYQTTGTLESGVSPLQSLTLNGAGSGGRCTSTFIPMRGRLRLVTPPLPGDASSSKIYELPSSSSPATSTMKAQTPYSSTYGALSDSFYINSYSSGGAAPDTGHPFPGATSSIKSDDAAGVTAQWSLGGDGSIVLPRLTVAQRPASPVAAQLLYDEDMGGPAFYSKFGVGSWAPVASQMAIAHRSYEAFTDFLGSASALGEFISLANNGGSATDDPGEANHPGIAHLNTGTTNNATGNAGIRLGVGGGSPPILLGNGVVRVACLMRPSGIATPFYHFRFGLDVAQLTSDPTVGFSFRFNNNVNGGKFQRAIGSTFTDTGAAAVVAFTWYLLEIVISADATSAEFFINGVSVGTSSGSAQTGGAVLLSAIIAKDTSTATARAAVLDYLGVAGEMTGARF